MANMKENIRETVSEAIEPLSVRLDSNTRRMDKIESNHRKEIQAIKFKLCLLYTSPSPRDLSTSRMPSSA